MYIYDQCADYYIRCKVAILYIDLYTCIVTVINLYELARPGTNIYTQIICCIWLVVPVKFFLFHSFVCLFIHLFVCPPNLSSCISNQSRQVSPQVTLFYPASDHASTISIDGYIYLVSDFIIVLLDKCNSCKSCYRPHDHLFTGTFVTFLH